MTSRVLASAVTLVCIATAPAPAQSPADRALAADVDSLFQRLMTMSDTPGLGVAVVQGNRPILVKGYGYSDVERRIPVTENTVFYIASVTKAFTALTLGLMAERRQIALDAPVSRFLRDAQWAPGTMLDGIRARVAEGRAERAQRPQTLNRPLEAFAGTYESPTGGVMTWTVRNGRLWATIGALESVAEVYDAQADQLRVELEPGFGTVVEFKFADGRATSLRHPSGEYVRR